MNQELENTHPRVGESRAHTHQALRVFTLSVKKQKLPHQEGKVGAAGKGKGATGLGQAGTAVERTPLDGTLETDRDRGRRQGSRSPRPPGPAGSADQPPARAAPRGGPGWSSLGSNRDTPSTGVATTSSAVVCSPGLASVLSYDLRTTKNSSKPVKPLVGENTIIHINSFFFFSFFIEG